MTGFISSKPAQATIECDVCVIGSGSGGSWLAHELVSAGLNVVMLEEGGYHTKSEFNLTEAFAYPNLYQELGNRTTDDLSVSMLQGRSVGGGTTVNWCSTFRTPQRILDVWRHKHGIETLSTEALTPHWEHIEKRLHVKEWPLELINRNNRILWEGLGALGYSRGLIRRNVNNCANIGYCGLGCPIDAKQSMLVTVLPDAVEKGLRLYHRASVRRIEWSGRRASAVHVERLSDADQPTGERYVVKPKAVAVCGGAINSPALLLRSGIDGKGRVGTRGWLHPVVVMLGEYEDRVDAFSGAPQSVYSHHFSEAPAGQIGFFLEVPPVHPMLAATISTGLGPQVQKLMGKLPHLSAMIALCIDGLLPQEQGLTVRLRDGGYTRHSLSYEFVPALFDAFRLACREMAKLHFAAGAKQVLSLHFEPVVLSSERDLPLLDAAPYAPLKLRIATAHQMGGCAMGADPAASVVDPTLRVHGMENLFVVDGSVLPTSLGVNPQGTIFGLGRWAAQHVRAAV